MSESTSAIPVAKPRPKVAAVSVDSSDLSLLREALGQRGVETIIIPPDTAAQRLTSQKFDGIAVRLNDSVEALLKSVRSSAVNKHAVLYGIADSLEHAQAFFKFGLNALLVTPLDRQVVTETVAATYRLLTGELRSYARVHLVTTVGVFCNGQSDQGTSWEVSGGGMSLRTKLPLEENQKVELAFQLPGAPTVRLSAVVSWKQPGTVGVRFDKSDARDVVRNWLYEYLEMT